MEMDLRANVARVENRLRNLELTWLTERLWAYLTVRKLLQTLQTSPDETMQMNAKQRALDLALEVRG